MVQTVFNGAIDSVDRLRFQQVLEDGSIQFVLYENLLPCSSAFPIQQYIKYYSGLKVAIFLLLHAIEDIFED